ncbi:MAG: hypothetical protein JXR03_13100 [Cyclobacteriaceae bacterium]
MSIQRLSDLKKKISPEASSLKLDEVFFDGKSIVSFWEKNFNSKEIVISLNDRNLLEDYVKLSGTSGSIFGLNGLAIEIYFFEKYELAVGEYRIHSFLVIDVKDQLFSSLPEPFLPIKYKHPEKLLTVLSTTHLEDVDFINTIEIDGIEKEFLPTLRAGVNIQSEVEVPSELAPVQSFIGSSNLSSIMGIQSSSLSKSFFFAAKLEKEFELGPLKVSPKLILFEGTKQNSGTSFYAEFQSDLKLGNIKAASRLQVDTSSGDIRILSDFEELSLANLGELASLFGKENPVKQLPAPLAGFGSLSLTNFQLVYSMKTKKVTSVVVDVSSTGSWEIIQGVFGIENLLLRWAIVDPFSQTRKTTFLMSGDMLIGDASIFMQAQFPEFIVFGDLRPGTSLNVGGALEKIGMTVGPLAPLKKLQIMDIELTAQPRNKSFELEMLIAANWELFTIAEKPYILKEITIDLEYATGNFSGVIAGILDFAGWDTRVTVFIEETLRIEGVIPYLNFSEIVEEFFSIVGVDVDVPIDFDFRDIAFSIVPSTKEFSISGVSASPWDFELGPLPKLSISNVGIDVDRKQVVAATGTTPAEHALDYTFFGTVTLAEKYSLTVRISNNTKIDEATNKETKGWLIDGQFEADGTLDFVGLINDLIPGESLDLPKDIITAEIYSVGISIDTIATTYSVEVATSISLGIDGIGGVEVSTFTLDYSKPAAEALWKVTASGKISLGDDFLVLPTKVTMEKLPKIPEPIPAA